MNNITRLKWCIKLQEMFPSYDTRPTEVESPLRDPERKSTDKLKMYLNTGDFLEIDLVEKKVDVHFDIDLSSVELIKTILTTLHDPL